MLLLVTIKSQINMIPFLLVNGQVMQHFGVFNNFVIRFNNSSWLGIQSLGSRPGSLPLRPFSL